MIQSTRSDKTPNRILVFGASDIRMQAIVDEIRTRLPSGSKLIVTGNKQDIGLTNLVRMEKRAGKIKKLLQNDKFSENQFDLISCAWQSEALMTGLDHLERKSESFVWRHHKLHSFSDSIHYYNVAVDFLSNFLLNERINLILFFEVPHLFVDTLSYQIARAQGINTLILTPSIFPDRFFSLRVIDDNGQFFPTSAKFDSKTFIIDSQDQFDWSYMQGISQHRGELGALNWQGILMLFVHLVTVSPSKIVRSFEIGRYLRRMQRISSLLPKWRYPFSRYFDIRHLNYFEYLIEFEDTEIDLDCKFVYFPLHLQPEMTTSALGGTFSDQLLALEKLSQILPDDCSIYVKENPKQGGQMRGAQFFHRINRIRNVHWLPSYANTYELIQNCQFVAVVTGTAGWEAICMKKKALVFGRPWFRNFPGIIQFHNGMTYEYICNYNFDHDTLERQVGQLFSRAHVGNIVPLKRRMSSVGYDLKSNADLVANSVIDLIEGKNETTFLS